MHIMCVCLFSALSRIGALQISIIIIITNKTGSNIASKNTSKHEARPPMQVLTLVCFACDGVRNVASYKRST